MIVRVFFPFFVLLNFEVQIANEWIREKNWRVQFFGGVSIWGNVSIVVFPPFFHFDLFFSCILWFFNFFRKKKWSNKYFVAVLLFCLNLKQQRQQWKTEKEEWNEETKKYGVKGKSNRNHSDNNKKRIKQSKTKKREIHRGSWQATHIIAYLAMQNRQLHL